MENSLMSKVRNSMPLEGTICITVNLLGCQTFPLVALSFINCYLWLRQLQVCLPPTILEHSAQVWQKARERMDEYLFRYADGIVLVHNSVWNPLLVVHWSLFHPSLFCLCRSQLALPTIMEVVPSKRSSWLDVLIRNADAVTPMFLIHHSGSCTVTAMLICKYM